MCPILIQWREMGPGGPIHFQVFVLWHICSFVTWTAGNRIRPCDLLFPLFSGTGEFCERENSRPKTTQTRKKGTEIILMSLKNASVLVIDDDVDVLTAVRLLLRPEVKEIVTEKNPENLRSLLAKQSFDAILLDMNFNSSINTGNEGIFWLKKIKGEFRSTAAVIMITAYGDIDLAIRSLKEGAFDFVVKPWHNERLMTTIREAVKRKDDKGSAAQALPSSSIFETELLGKSEVMQDIFYKIQKIAPTDANILILGENGTGKELIAKAIHHFFQPRHETLCKGGCRCAHRIPF